ncbi:MAG: TauD/TfdA family dioxygenase [Gammaproteobacteria bacterium]|nr:TauD/TfdA family dioxygenase [Gammaproteobacteria bacterium]
MHISKVLQQKSSPFDLNDEFAYENWKKNKLNNYPASIEQLIVSVSDPFNLSAEEKAAMLSICQKTNMVLYQLDNVDCADKKIPTSIAAQLGMSHIDNHLCVDEDGVSPLQVSENKVRRDYIPYTNRPINWHTDGYYNTPEHTIKGMVLHCVNPAASGGNNSFVDHEIAYMHLRDKNPDFIRVLMQNDVMTIPPNDLTGEVIRPEQSGPVFSVLDDGFLHMRFTARGRNIVWKDDPLVKAAVEELVRFLNSDDSKIFHHLMQTGQGIISNNVLHKRTGFEDDVDSGLKRLIYRSRYYDRIH